MITYNRMQNNFLIIKIKARRLSNLKVFYSSSKFPIVSNSNFRNFKPPPMSNSNFKSPPMSNNNFKPPPMSNNNFKPSRMSNSNFKPSPMSNSNFKPSPMSNSNFRSPPPSISNSNFKPSPMSNSNFRSPPPMSNSNFKSSPMSNSNFRSPPPPISNSNFKPSPMSNSNFGSPPPMSNSNFKSSLMSNSNFKPSPISNPNRNKYDKYELSKFHRFSNKNKLNKPDYNWNKPDTNKYNNNNFRSNIYFPVTKDNKKLNDNDNNNFRKSNIYSAVMRDNIKVIKKEEKEEEPEVDDLSLFGDTGYTSYVTDLPENFEEAENVVGNDENVVESGDGVVAVENSENSKNSSSKKKKKYYISPKLNKDEIQIVMEGYKDYYNKNYCMINFALLEDFPSWLNGLGLKPLAPYFEGLKWREIIEFSWHDLETSGITNWHLRKRLLRHFYSVRKFLAKERKIRLPAIDFSNLALVKGENDVEEDWYGHVDMGVLNDTECFLHSLGDGLGKLVPYFYGMKWKDLCQLSFRDLLLLRIDNTGTRKLVYTRIGNFKRILQALVNQTRKKEIEYDLSDHDDEEDKVEGSDKNKGKTKPRFDAMKLIEDAEISLRHSLMNKSINRIIKDKKYRHQDF
ncbi:hypothetical protein Glove_301g59 [Diversispora epigaea]|uniref:SAM domain-containing protein n=1 Tax=Diversispora epigaea TaxID=1348612 RepID=A0A397HWN3_9GLOM|nr:hypothetical protein Glove_301g59 [Diversispora epigaea]